MKELIEIKDSKQLAEVQANAGDGLVIIDFYAPWCSPCKVLLPVVEKVAKQSPNITFTKANVDVAQGLAAAFEVMSVPTVVALKGDKVVGRFTGFRSEAGVKDYLAQMEQNAKLLAQ